MFGNYRNLLVGRRDIISRIMIIAGTVLLAVSVLSLTIINIFGKSAVLNMIVSFYDFFMISGVISLFMGLAVVINNFRINRQKLLFIIIVFVLGLAAFLYRLYFSGVIFPSNDGYHDTALNFFCTGNIEIFNRRSLPYPFLVTVVSGLFGNVNAVLYFQYILGILTGFILALIVIFLWNIFFDEKNGIKYIIALFFYFLFIFNIYNMNIEHFIKLESVSQFFLLLQILLLILFYIRRLPIIALFLIPYSIFMVHYQVKFVFISMLVLLVIGVIAVTDIIKSTGRLRRLLKCSILFSIGIFIYIILKLTFNSFVIPDRINVGKIRQKTDVVLAHMSIIGKDMAEDYNNINFNKYDKAMLSVFVDFYDRNDKIFNKKNENIKSSEFNSIKSEFLGLVIDSQRYFNGDHKGAEEFLSYYFLNSLKKHPEMYVVKILLEFKKIFKQETFFIVNSRKQRFRQVDKDKVVNWTNEYKERFPGYSGIRVVSKYIDDISSVKVDNIRRGKTILFLNAFYDIIKNSYIIVFIITSLLFVYLLIRKRFDCFYLKALFIYGFTLLVPLLHLFFTAFAYILMPRYVAELSSVFMIWYICGIFICVRISRDLFMVKEIVKY